MKRRGHFICSGRVQGVFFRASARDKAQHLNLTGWVRNCQNGTVEAVVEGDIKAIDDFYSWCQTGPTYASVSNVKKIILQPQKSSPSSVSSYNNCIFSPYHAVARRAKGEGGS